MDPWEGARTDLALEAQQLAARRGADVPGVLLEERQLGFGVVTTLKVESDLGAQVMGKSKGTYVTIQVPDFQVHRRELESDVSRVLAGVIGDYLASFRIPTSAPALVVGLGNWNSTPDNVGPATVAKILVTRHLHEYRVLSEELLGRMRPVAALSPGVLGLTGVETAEIVQGVVQKVRPALVICVDALAAMSVERLGCTVQVSDAGISPGSGVGNKRMSLTQETLGVPVLAIGVPTVIYATTIVSDALEALERKERESAETRVAVPAPGAPQREGALLDPARIVLGPLQTSFPSAGPLRPAAERAAPALDGARRRAVIQEVLGGWMGSLVVTPKEIDVMVDSLSDVLADGLNEALHPGISAEEAAQFR